MDATTLPFHRAGGESLGAHGHGSQLVKPKEVSALGWRVPAAGKAGWIRHNPVQLFAACRSRCYSLYAPNAPRMLLLPSCVAAP